MGHNVSQGNQKRTASARRRWRCSQSICRGVAHGEGRPPGVEQDDGFVPQQAHRLPLPVGATADAPGQEHGRQGTGLVLFQGLDVSQLVTPSPWLVSVATLFSRVEQGNEPGPYHVAEVWRQGSHLEHSISEEAVAKESFELRGPAFLNWS